MAQARCRGAVCEQFRPDRSTYTVDFSFHKSEANSKLRTNIAIMYIGYQTFWSIPFATPRHHVVIMS